MLSTFLTLPVEVIEGVADLLDCTGLCAVRLASKVLYQKTLDLFGRTYFTVLQTDFSLNSLQTLWAISQTENLRQHVQIFQVVDWRLQLGQGLLWHRVEGNPRTAHLDTRLSLGAQVLRDILRNLTNCRSFEFHSPYFEGRKEHYQSKRLRPSDYVYMVFEAVTERGIPVKSFRIDCCHYKGLDTTRLQKQLYQQPKYMAAWEKLEELRVLRYPTVANLGWARDLILHNMDLKTLALYLYEDETTEFLASILCSMRSCLGLREIELKFMRTTGLIVASLLLRCRSRLRKLSISAVYICCGTWVKILSGLRSFRSLEYIEVEWLKESADGKVVCLQFPALDVNSEVPGSGGQKFSLRYQEWDGKKRVCGATYQGLVGMDKALEILTESAENNDGLNILDIQRSAIWH